MRVAHVSTFPDMKCGIAFYASDLIASMPMLKHRKYSLHYGENLTHDAVGHADVSNPSNLRRLAREISRSDCDVVSLQHEFGIWGGIYGEYIYEFLDAIDKPIVATLHTTFKGNSRPAIQRSILRRIVEKSAVCVVLTPDSQKTLRASLGLLEEVVCVIPHGVPDIPFVAPSFTRDHAPEGVTRWRFCSIGFFRPDKGIEEILNALAVLKARGFHFHYVIAGSPQSQFAQQEAYRNRVQDLVVELQLNDAVTIDVRFLSQAEQVRIIQDAHVGVFAYQDPDQSSSGAIPLVMAAGRPVVCTPFEYAVAKEIEVGKGVTVARDFSATAIAEALADATASASDYVGRAAALHAQTRPWIWKTVGATYVAAFQNACGGWPGSQNRVPEVGPK